MTMMVPMSRASMVAPVRAAARNAILCRASAAGSAG